MAAWNGVGTRVALVPAPRRSAARVVVTLLPRGSAGADVGQATLGWTPARPGEGRGAAGPGSTCRGRGARARARARPRPRARAAGLLGDGRNGRRRRPTSRLPDRPVRQARGLSRDARRRGGAARPVRATAARSAPRGVEGVSARVVRSDGSFLELAWTSPLAGPGGAVLVRAERGRCPTTPYGVPLARTGSIPLERGALQSAALPLSRSGAWCAGLWVQESTSFLTGPPDVRADRRPVATRPTVTTRGVTPVAGRPDRQRAPVHSCGRDPARRREGAVRASHPGAQGPLRRGARLRAVHLRSRGRGVRARGRRVPRRAARDRRRERHRRARALARGARDRPGRRGDLPGLHLLRDRRGDRPSRCDAGLRGHRPGHAERRPRRRGGPADRAARRRSCRCTCSVARPRWRSSRRSASR